MLKNVPDCEKLLEENFIKRSYLLDSYEKKKKISSIHWVLAVLVLAIKY